MCQVVIDITPLKEIRNALSKLGYRNGLLRNGYEYADVFCAGEIRTALFAGFAQSPPSYRNACIGVISANGDSSEDLVARHRALGAPLIFEISNDTIRRWAMTRSGAPTLRESFSHGQIEEVFATNKDIWNPDSIFRGKAIGTLRSPYQMDFIDVGLLPAVEGEIHGRLNRLLHEAFDTLRKPEPGHAKPGVQDVFRIIFRFVAAKVFRDRRYPGRWMAKDAEEIFKAIDAYYGPSSASHRVDKRLLRKEFLEKAWQSISHAFHFQNLSVDDLAFVYENTLISEKTRAQFGTHSTPPRVAEYITRKLPFDQLPRQCRRVFEPCSGHGILLISAMRRLRELLPANLSDVERHRYLKRNLVGMEIDAFAVEVSRLCLMLADYPNPNGWRLYQEDVFSSERTNKEIALADVVLANPPFEDFSITRRSKYSDSVKRVQPPAELLRRILLHPPRMIGIVMPTVFTTGTSYSELSRRVSKIYGDIETVALPEVFNYSEARTVLLMAWNRRQANRIVRLTCRTVKRSEATTFLGHGIEPVGRFQVMAVPNAPNPKFRLWIPDRFRIWQHLAQCPRLRSIAVIHQGIHWKGQHNLSGRISSTPRPGFKKGFARVEDCLQQFALAGECFVSVRPDSQHDKAFLFPWDKPKAVCNRARKSRSLWRLAAAADPEGLVFSQQFIALWPRSQETSIHAVAALLNSPLANAFCFDRDSDIDNRISTIGDIPIPSGDLLKTDGVLHEKSILLADMLRKTGDELFAAPHALRNLLLEIDSLILAEYDLPPSLERELLDFFEGIPRPVPFDFKAYYPAGMTAYLPLKELVSDKFRNARVSRLRARLKPIRDEKISGMLQWLNK
jgi:hypothetical protein